MRFKEITLSGTPYERGFAYGQQCKDEIAVSLDAYQFLFKETKGINWEVARKISEYYIELTRAYNPDYVEEIRGIAEGAGVPFEDIAALNTRTEIMYSDALKAAKDEKAEPQECTVISLTPPAAADGHVIAAQNWDYSGRLRESVVIVHVKQEDKPDFVMVTEGGMIGGIGMNDHGVAVMLNALKTTVSCKGVPLRARMRAMLESKNLSDAYVIGGVEPVTVANLTIVHKDGVALGFEMDADIVEPMIPDDGVLVHTNHYLGLKTYLKNDVNHMGSSYIRLQRIKYLIKERYGKITAEDIMEMLRDHAGYPQSICDHMDMDFDMTNFSIIMDLTDNAIWLAPDCPCENEFERIYV